MNLRDELDKLAEQIAKKASLSDTSLQESIDALKVLTPYYALTQKLKTGDEDPSDGATFDTFSAEITGTEERQNGRTTGSAQIRSRRQPS